jgi:cytochrome c550
MKKNPVIPYAMIAVLGIVAMIVLASVGVNQMDEVRGDHGGTEQEDGNGEAVSTDPEAIFQNNCSMCHGADLAGTNSAPALNTIGAEKTKEEIEEIIKNGVEGTMMTGSYASKEEAALLAEWLSEKK